MNNIKEVDDKKVHFNTTLFTIYTTQIPPDDNSKMFTIIILCLSTLLFQPALLKKIDLLKFKVFLYIIKNMLNSQVSIQKIF